VTAIHSVHYTIARYVDSPGGDPWLWIDQRVASILVSLEDAEQAAESMNRVLPDKHKHSLYFVVKVTNSTTIERVDNGESI
jgi:hypothetical protein